MKSSPENSISKPTDARPDGSETQNQVQQSGLTQLEKSLERVSDAIVALDTNWIYTYVNAKAAQSFGRTPEQMIGKHIWTEFPEGVDQPFYKAYYRAVETQQPITLEEYYPPYDRWFENRIYPSQDGLTIFFNDITTKKKAEQALQDSNQYNRMLFDHSPIGLALCRMDGTLVDVNDAYASMIGYSRAETLTLSYWSITPDKYGQQEQEQLSALETSGQYGPYEKEYIHKDGHLVPVLLSGIVVEISNERFILSTVEDISKRKQMDAITRQQQAFINSLANTLPAIIYIYDLETQSNVYSNFGIERILNYTPQDITKMGSELFIRLVHPDDLADVISHQANIFIAGDDDILEIEYRMQHSNGKWIWLHSYERPFLRNPDGSLKQTIGIAVDITQQKSIEQEIEMERNFSAIALESLPGIFYMYDESFQFTRWNENFEKVSGYSAKEISSMSPLDFFTGQEKELLAERIAEVFEKGSSSVVADFVSKDGTRTPHFFTGKTISIANRQYLMGVGIDITEQIQAQTDSERKEKILRQVIEHTPAAIAMFDRDMRYIAYSQRFLADYKLGNQNLIGKSHYEVFPEISQAWKEIHRRCQAGAVEYADADPFPRKDGKIDYVRWEIQPWYDTSGEINGIILFSEVITEQKEAELALIESQIKLQSILDQTSSPIYIKDLNGRLTFVNKKMETLFGVSANELIGKTSYDIHSKEIADQHHANDLEVMSSKAPISAEENNMEGDGLHTYLSVKFPLFDANGEIFGICGISTDITERIRTAEEIRLSRDTIRQISVRLAEAQETERKNLSKELHDRVGQNLTALGISLNILRSQLDTETQQKLSTRFETLSSLVTNITDQMRGVMAELHPPVLDDYGLAAALRWYTNTIMQNSPIQINVEGDLVEPRLDLSSSMALYRITQEALNNILKHARATNVNISLKNVYQTVQLIIEDNGIGFDPALSSDQTRPHWGISTMQERAHAINGKLEIHSSPGSGTRIIVTIAR